MQGALAGVDSSCFCGGKPGEEMNPERVSGLGFRFGV